MVCPVAADGCLRAGQVGGRDGRKGRGRSGDVLELHALLAEHVSRAGNDSVVAAPHPPRQLDEVDAPARYASIPREERSGGSETHCETSSIFCTHVQSATDPPCSTAGISTSELSKIELYSTVIAAEKMTPAPYARCSTHLRQPR